MTQLTGKARRLIDGRNLAFLATLDADGSPQVSPVWIDRDGDTIRVNTAAGRVKDRNMRRDLRVAVAVANREDDYERVAIRGRVVDVDETDAANAHIDLLARKYTEHESYPWHKEGERRVIFLIEPERVANR